MGIFGKLFGGDQASRAVQELLTLKSKISELYPNPIFNLKTGKAEDPTPAICAAIDIAVQSLETGLFQNEPITKTAIASILTGLAADIREIITISLISGGLS